MKEKNTILKKISSLIFSKEHGMCNLGKDIAQSCKQCPHILKPACKKSNKIKENFAKGMNEEEIYQAIKKKVGTSLEDTEIRERIKKKLAA